MLIFAFTYTVSSPRYLKSHCVTWLPKTCMLIFSLSDIVCPPPLPTIPLRYLVTQNIDADIVIVWHCLSAPLPKVPLRYLVTQNIHTEICLYWHSLSAPLPKVPLRYLVTQNIDVDILIVWHYLSPPLPKVPLCYLVTKNIHVDICLYWHSLSAPLPKVPLRYLVTQNIDANILIVWLCRTLRYLKSPCVTLLSKIYMLIFAFTDTVSLLRYLDPLVLPGYPNHTCWNLPLLTQSLRSVT